MLGSKDLKYCRALVRMMADNRKVLVITMRKNALFTSIMVPSALVIVGITLV